MESFVTNAVKREHVTSPAIALVAVGVMAMVLLFAHGTMSSANVVAPGRDGKCGRVSPLGDGAWQAEGGLDCDSTYGDQAGASLNAPAAPTLISPANGSVITTIIPALLVDTGLEGVLHSVEYEYWINATSIFTIAGGCGKTTRSDQWRDWDNYWAGRTFLWRAHVSLGDVCNDNPVWSPWSPTWSFTTPSNPARLPVPQPIAPISDTAISSLPVWVSWQPVTGQLGLVIMWTTPSSPGTTFYAGSWDNVATTYPITRHMSVGNTYYWWMHVRNDQAWGGDSDHRKLTWPVAASPTRTPTRTRTATPTRTPTATAVPPPVLAVAPASLSILAGPGLPAQPQVLTVLNTGSGTLQWDASAPVGWLTVHPTSGQATAGSPGHITVTASINGLAPGLHTANISVSSSTAGVQGSPKTVPVHLSIVPSLRRVWLPVIVSGRAP